MGNIRKKPGIRALTFLFNLKKSVDDENDKALDTTLQNS